MNTLNDQECRKFREIKGITGVSVFSIDGSAPIEGNNASMIITESTSGTVTTTTLTQTIGTKSYTKTIASNSSDNSTTISSWSEV
jgi:hypothetical protein